QGSVTGNVLPNGVTDDVRPVIQGTAEAGSTVNVYADGVLIGSVVADAKGVWQVESSVDLPQGLNNITATATNVAGTVSPATAVYPIVVDITAPAA
ncbi:Ig-like domain-containing protein, partial [Pseudomonas poae]|uniref:Ig-like domain-containing protein n=1 Tax=Pseudomonas poae TaxID=200451 RepID=UPI0016118086